MAEGYRAGDPEENLRVNAPRNLLVSTSEPDALRALLTRHGAITDLVIAIDKAKDRLLPYLERDLPGSSWEDKRNFLINILIEVVRESFVNILGEVHGNPSCTVEDFAEAMKRVWEIVEKHL